MAIYANSAPVQNTLEQYIPLPMDQLWKAGQAIQERGDKAQAAQEQVQIGLASMEANLPGHRQFVNQFANEYKAKASALLDKYGNNTSDPNFIRESRQLGLQFAANPNLKTIQYANQLYQQKQKIKSQLQAEGKKFIDTNPNPLGVDDNGQFNYNVGDLRGTNFDDNIDKSFKNLENATEDVNGTITNKRNLIRNLKTYMTPKGGLDLNNKDVADGITYYQQQGQTPEQAQQTVLQHLNAGLAYGKDLKDHFREQQASDWAKFNINRQDRFALKAMDLEARAKRDAAKNQANIVNPGELAPVSSPILSEGVNKPKLTRIDTILGNLNDKGGIKKQNLQVDDTPENRKAYAGKIRGEGTTAIPYSDKVNRYLSIDNNYDESELKVLKEARDVLGDKAKNSKGEYLSDKRVLSNYRAALSSSQADSYNYMLPVQQKYNKALTEQYFGNKLESLGNDYTVVTSKGKFKAGTKEAEEALANVESVKMMGVNSAPLDTYSNGTIAAQATTKSTKDNKGRENVMIIKPMDSNMASQFATSNKANSALLSDFNNSDFINNPQAKSLRVVNTRTKTTYVPQKGLTNSNKVGITYYPLVNGKLDKSSPLSIEQIENGDHSAFFSRLGQSIATKPESQNYSSYTQEDDE